MSVRRVLVARISLLMLVVYGVARVIDPQARWAAGEMRGDQIEHALLVYGLTLALLMSFRRLSLPVVCGGMLGLGLAVEVVQSLPGVPGGFQASDLMADLAGVLLASLPFVIGRARAHGRLQPAE